MKIKVTISLKGVVRQDEVAGGFVTFCPALTIYAHGKTSEDAMLAMEKTLSLYLETCFRRGTLDSVLKKAGFEPVAGYPAAIPLTQIDQEFVAIEKLKYDSAFDIEVPVYLVAQAQVSELQHA
jgi:predicted RNase H-like HicB family nuclease